MAEWEFPNAIAVVAWNQALRRGQTAFRVVPRSADDSRPESAPVRLGGRCALSPLGPHTNARNREWCDSCGALIAGG